MPLSTNQPSLDDMVLLVIPEDDNIKVRDLTDGMFVSMRLVRYTDVINGWHSIPEHRDARFRFITEEMLPTLRSVGLLRGNRPTGTCAVTMVQG